MQNKRQLISRCEFQRGKIIGSGDQHQPVEIQTVFFRKILGKPDGTGCPIRFAGQIFRGRPAFITGNIKPDKISDRFHVIFVAEKITFLVADDSPGITGIDRVNKDQVRHIQDRVFVVNKRCREFGNVAVCIQADTARTQKAHMHPHGRRSRTAVERECQRSLRDVSGFIQCVSSEEYLKTGFLPFIYAVLDRLLTDDHCPDGHGVTDLFSVDRNTMF